MEDIYGNTSTTNDITIPVTDTTAPVLTSDSLLSNITDGSTALGTVSANEPVIWSISVSVPANNSDIMITPDNVLTPNATVKLKSTAPANYLSIPRYTYTITATDGNNNTSTVTKTVDVTDGTPPSLNSTNLVSSINDTQTALGYVISNETVNWSLDIAAASVISITSSTVVGGVPRGTTGTLTLKSAANYQTAQSYTYTITATDDAGNSSAITKSGDNKIVVIDTTAPVINSNGLVDVINNGDRALGSVTVANEMTITLSINPAAASIISISDAGNGTFNVTLNSPAVYLTAQSYTYTITATDGLSLIHI